LLVAALFGVLNFLLGWLLFAIFAVATLGIAWLLAFITRWIINAILLVITDKLTDHLKIDSLRLGARWRARDVARRYGRRVDGALGVLTAPLIGVRTTVADSLWTGESTQRAPIRAEAAVRSNWHEFFRVAGQSRRLYRCAP
jgi:hypothetical protein